MKYNVPNENSALIDDLENEIASYFNKLTLKYKGENSK
jgi:hypothetical protein